MSDQLNQQNPSSAFFGFIKLLMIGVLISTGVIFGIKYLENKSTSSSVSAQSSSSGASTGDMMRVVSGDTSGPPPNAGGTPPAGAPL